jgi:hypothetical protein
MKYRAHLSIGFDTDRGACPDETADTIVRDMIDAGFRVDLDSVTEPGAEPGTTQTDAEGSEAWRMIPATLDMETLRAQAGEVYAYAETLRATDPDMARRMHSVAALLFHLEDGSYALSVSVTVANRGRY